MKSSILRRSLDLIKPSGTTHAEPPQDKPLPDTPSPRDGKQQPQVLQVNAFGPRQTGSRTNPTPRPPRSHGPASQNLLPELGFDKLSINDPTDTADDTQDSHTSKSPRVQGPRPPPTSFVPTHTILDGRADEDEPLSRPTSELESPNLIVPNTTASKNPTSDRVAHGDGFTNLNESPNAAAAVRRKELPPTAHLPSGFNQRHTVDISVKTTQAPAVTQEVIRKHTEEIIHERITRDIHVEHYYNYVQPVKEVIIKPAIHFTIDESGNKVRIPTPDCWEVPPGFTPTQEDSD